jgi:hypothetical protein
MHKAHLYEAILLVNRGIDEAVQGLERLKRARDFGLDAACFDEKVTMFEIHRALGIPDDRDHPFRAIVIAIPVRS